MEDGAEITVDSVQQFIDGFRNDILPINRIGAVHKTARKDYVPSWIFEEINWQFYTKYWKPCEGRSC